MRLLLLGHLGNIHKLDSELVHVSPTRSREYASEFSKIGIDTTAAVYWPEAEKRLSNTLQYKHIDKINAKDYDVIFCHLMLSIQQLSNLSRGIQITQGAQAYGRDKARFQAILDHPKICLQLDAPRALDNDPKVDADLISRLKIVAVATENAVPKWKKLHPSTNVEWINAATIAYKYPGPASKSPYPPSNNPRVLYLGRMNDASRITPLAKIHHIASKLPEVEFHIVTNKIRDGSTNSVFAINELQTGSGREIRFHAAEKLIKAPNIFLHRGSRYDQSFDWMHEANCAIGFAVRPDQDVASCKSWEYFGTGVPSVIEEGTPETWVLKEVAAGEAAKYADWGDFADKIRTILNNPSKYKRRKTRQYIAANHGYDSRVKQWIGIMDKYLGR